MRHKTALRNAFSVLVSIQLALSLVPMQAFAEAADMAGDDGDSQPIETTHTIHFDGDGAESGEIDDLEWKSVDDGGEVSQEGQVTLPEGAAFTRDGYEFKGWSTTPDGQDVVKKDVFGNDERDADGNPVVDMRAYFVPNLADLDMLAYSYDADEDGRIEADETFDLTECERDGVLTLYAQWEKAPADADAGAEAPAATDDATQTPTDDGGVDDSQAPPVATDDAQSDADATTDGDAQDATPDATDSPDEQTATDESHDTSDDANASDRQSTSDGQTSSEDQTPSEDQSTSNDENVSDGENASDDQEAVDAGQADEPAKAEVNDPSADKDRSRDDGATTDDVATEKIDTSDDVLPDGDLTKLNMVDAPRLTMRRFLALAPAAANDAGSDSDSKDGSKIESAEIKWLTEDSPSDDGDPAHLLITTSSDADMQMRLQVNAAFSGSHDYAVGDIRITIPKNVIKTRDGTPTGKWSLSVPEAPDAKATFAYTETDDSYVLTNVRRLPAATQVMFQFSIKNVTPHTVNGNPGAYTSDPLGATVELVTNEGDVITKKTGDITASFDTSSYINGANVRMEDWHASWPSSWPSSLKPADPDNWLYVHYYSYAWAYGNQPYGLSVTHKLTSPDADMQGGVILGIGANGRTIKGNGTGTLSADLASSSTTLNTSTGYTEVYAAFPKPAGATTTTLDGTYHGVDTATYTLTSVDDKAVTTASDQASATMTFAPYRVPYGTYNIFKWGGSTYPTALNDLSEGKDASASYTVEAVAYSGTWTKDPSTTDVTSPDQLHKRPVTLETTDDKVQLDGEALNDDDYDITSVSVSSPYTAMYQFYPDGGYSQLSGEVPTGSWGYATGGTADPVKVEAYTGGAWQTVTESGSGTVRLPAGTKQVRVTTGTTADYIRHYFYPTVTVHSTAHTKGIADRVLADSEYPSANVVNSAQGRFLYSDGTLIGTSDRKSGTDYFQGLYQSAHLYKRASFSNDPSNRQVDLTYSVELRETTNATSQADYDRAIEAGAASRETGGTFYDLLPKGVEPDTSSVAVSNGSVESVRLTRDYKGSGRTLMTVRTKLTPSPHYIYDSVSGIGDNHVMSFKAVYSWESINDYGSRITNNAAFESDNSWVGNVSGGKGEADDPTGTNNTQTRYATTGVTDVLRDLDPDRDDPSFLYAADTTDTNPDVAAVTSLSKRVSVNGSGTYSDGTGADELNVYESGAYTYRLHVENDDKTKAKDIVLYDDLEAFHPSEASGSDDAGDTQWTGTLAGVDTSQLRDKGIDPVVYYSTVPRDQLDLATSATASQMDLSDASVWSKDAPSDLSKVTAIAIDCTRKADGSEFVLGSKESISAYVSMKAPRATDVSADDPEDVYDTTLATGQSESGLTGGAHAYNAASLVATQGSTDTGVWTSGKQLVHNEYTKVGLIPYKVEVTKSFDDADDQDGIRPKSVTVHLLSNGTDTGKAATLSADNDWTADFTDVPATDDAGQMVDYSFAEDAVDGYTASGRGSYDREKGAWVVPLTNTHTPETTTVSGTKTWDDEGNQSKRPSSVTVSLYRDGTKVRTTSTNEASGWKYSFADLPVFHDHGQRWNYTVQEDAYYAGYVPKNTSDTDVTNTYDPYGDVTLTKTITNATDASKGADHVFTFTLTDADGNPVPGTFDYEVTDGRTGQVSNGQTISLKGGQTATVKRLPSEDTYSFREAPASGYVQTAATGASGTVLAGRTVAAEFTDDYDTDGSVTIQAKKTLTGRDIARYQFRFDLLNSDGTVIRSATNDADGTVTFGRIRYGLSDVGKTYTYTIRETDSGKPGYTYDSHTETVTVTVADNGDGTITATPAYDSDGATFSNQYHASGETQMVAWKKLPGRNLVNGEFSFKLVPNDGAPIRVKDASGNVVDATDGQVTATNQAGDGTIDFPALQYDETDVGKTYTYTASEIKGTDDTVTYTDQTYTYQVKVVDNGDGTLSFDQGTADGSTPVFQNNLKPGNLTIQKIVPEGKGNPSNPNQEFTFHVKVTLPDGSPLPDGTYQLKREAIPTSSVERLVGIVADALRGLADALKPTVALAETPVATFTNEFNQGTASASITGQKLLDGAPTNTPFTFELSENGTVLQTKQSGSGGAISFDLITYAAAGDHTYTIREVPGTDPTINYDSHVETVRVSVANDGQGYLMATTTYDSDGVVFKNTTKPGSIRVTKAVTGTSATDKDFHVTVTASDGTSQELTLRNGGSATVDNVTPGSTFKVTEHDLPDGYSLEGIDVATGTVQANQTTDVHVTNSYAATGIAVIEATKRLEGATLADGQFEFGLFEDGREVSSATNAVNGAIAFEPIDYTAAGTHHYEIRELSKTDDKWVCDGHTATADVTVTDEGDGHLATAVTYGTGTAAPTFVNRPADGEIRIAKTWSDGTNPAPAHRASFDVTLTAADGSAYAGTVTGGVYDAKGDKTADLSIPVNAGHVVVTQAVESGGTIRLTVPQGTSYSVSENAVAGYAPTSENTTGTVTNVAQTASFANDYSSSGEWVPVVTKTLSGGQLTDGQFTFVLATDKGVEVSRATNKADGTVTFPAIELDDSMMGEDNAKTYAFREVKGADSGIAYDKSVHTARVWGTDDGQGHRVAHVIWDAADSENQAPAFANAVTVPVPFTGAQGIALLVAIALAVVAASVAVILHGRKDDDKDE